MLIRRLRVLISFLEEPLHVVELMVALAQGQSISLSKGKPNIVGSSLRALCLALRSL